MNCYDVCLKKKSSTFNVRSMCSNAAGFEVSVLHSHDFFTFSGKKTMCSNTKRNKAVSLNLKLPLSEHTSICTLHTYMASMYPGFNWSGCFRLSRYSKHTMQDGHARQHTAIHCHALLHAVKHGTHLYMCQVYRSLSFFWSCSFSLSRANCAYSKAWRLFLLE